jgi:serine/threonine protein kinase
MQLHSELSDSTIFAIFCLLAAEEGISRCGIRWVLSGGVREMARTVFETATSVYTSAGTVGDGGCGTVYRVTDTDGDEFALKLLRETSAAKRKRFKNELAFCRRNQHARIIRVVDEGVFIDGIKHLPFYVMPLYGSTLRKLIDAGVLLNDVLPMFSDILDGVEAAHLQGVVHRDIKPENLLVSVESRSVVVADFGIAHFHEADLLTAVETRDGERLANYRYSAPEQRAPGGQVDERADIFALGLVLNEMFTGEVPQGTGHKQIAEIAPNYAYLDVLVDGMIQQSTANRPRSIAKIKERLIAMGSEFVAKQRLDDARKAVVSEATPNDPLGGQDIRIGHATYENGAVVCQLSAPPPPDWIIGLQNPRFGYSSIVGDAEPASVQFSGAKAILRATARTAEATARHFNSWVAAANQAYRELLKQKAAEQQQRERERIRTELQRVEAEAKVAEALGRISFS